jgi:hypothetical protein
LVHASDEKRPRDSRIARERLKELLERSFVLDAKSNVNGVVPEAEAFEDAPRALAAAFPATFPHW